MTIIMLRLITQTSQSGSPSADLYVGRRDLSIEENNFEQSRSHRSLKARQQSFTRSGPVVPSISEQAQLEAQPMSPPTTSDRQSKPASKWPRMPSIDWHRSNTADNGGRTAVERHELHRLQRACMGSQQARPSALKLVATDARVLL